MKDIIIVTTDDYEQQALYIDGDLKLQNYVLIAEDVLDILSNEFPGLFTVDIQETSLEESDDFPQDLDDLDLL